MNYNFLLFKPSKYFYIFCIVVFPIWFLLGPISWRHIDDYGPMYTFIQKYISDSEFVFPADYSNINPLKIFVSSLTDNYGWGSYPQLWSIIYLPLSLSFIKYGLDITRYITISIGFLTCTLISFLLSNIITILIANKNKIKNKYFEKLRLNSDFFACLIVLFSPQIMLHSITYMPYQIASISTLIIFYIFINFQSKNLINNIEHNLINKKTLFIKNELIFIFIWIAILLSWQSLFILIAFILYLTNNFLFKKNYKNKRLILERIIYSIKNFLFNLKLNTKSFTFSFYFLLLSYFSKIYIIKFINLNKLGHINGLPFAWGFGNEYNLNLFNSSITTIHIKDLLFNLIFLMARIFSLALYPFRVYQNYSAFFTFIIFVITITFLFKYSKVSANLSIFILFSFLVPVLFSIAGKFILAPSRHAIYLFPCIWIPVGTFIVNQFLFNQIFLNKLFSKSLKFLLIIFFLNGLIISHKSINYSNNLQSKILKIAEKADYFPVGKFVGQYDLVSLFWTHGSREWDVIKGKECRVNQINLKNKLIFLFSHTIPFDENSKTMNNLTNIDFFPNEYECISKNTKLKFVDSVEFHRNTDIEVDNLIKNGGSNAYAYLIKVIE